MFVSRFRKMICAMMLAGALLCGQAGAARIVIYEPGKKSLNPAELAALAASAPTEQGAVDELLRLMNLVRERAGLAPLAAHEALSQVATVRAEEVGATGIYSHYSVTYGSAFQMMRSTGLVCQKAAENIAWGFWDPLEVVIAWLDSPTHRNNLLDPEFTNVGVGYSLQGDVWCVLFQG